MILLTLILTACTKEPSDDTPSGTVDNGENGNQTDDKNNTTQKANPASDFEYIIDGNRRIDLYIETISHKIPIEVKIHAGDQDKQCFDYYKKYINCCSRNFGIYSVICDKTKKTGENL
jgi:hypothetical protein